MDFLSWLEEWRGGAISFRAVLSIDGGAYKSESYPLLTFSNQSCSYTAFPSNLFIIILVESLLIKCHF